MAHREPALQVHVPVGLALVVVSLVLIRLAAGHRLWLALSVPGWTGIVGAAFNGAGFLNYGHGTSSLLMSVGFLLAAVSYLTGLVVTR